MEYPGSVLRKNIFYILTLFISTESLGGIPSNKIIEGNSGALSCTIQQGGVVSFPYNDIQPSMINKLHVAPLQVTSRRISVLCNTPSKIFLKFYGNSNYLPATAEQTYYSLGYINSSGNLGYFTINISNSIVDGVAGEVSRGRSKKNIEKTSGELTVGSDYYYAASINGKVTPSTVVSFDVSVHPFLNKLKDTNGPLINGAELDGNVELVISYDD